MRREFHDVANLFPMMTDEDFENLKTDIAANGLLEPIWLHPDGRIIDGRNRYNACLGLGIEPAFRTWNGNGSLVSFVVSLNLHRRHLTASQRAAAAVDILPALEEEAKERMLSTQNNRAAMEIIPQQGEQGKARDHAAELLHVNPRYIQDAKKINTESPELFDRVRRGEMTIPEARKENNKRKKNETLNHYIEQSKNKPVSEYAKIYHGDFRVLMEDIADNSIDLIFTDPPYNEDAISLYGDLAEIASRKLKPGGSLLAYAGHYALPQYLELMTAHLRYWWIITASHAGANARLPGKYVFVHWKPVLWFVNDTRRLDLAQLYVGDKFHSTWTDDDSKKYHDWQQPVDIANYYIDHLTNPGDLVVDPFLGGGTTGVAAIRNGRKFIGYELNEQSFKIAQARITNE